MECDRPRCGSLKTNLHACYSMSLMYGVVSWHELRVEALYRSCCRPDARRRSAILQTRYETGGAQPPHLTPRVAHEPDRDCRDQEKRQQH